MIAARNALRGELAKLDKRARELAKENRACRLLMSVPGVGPLTALTFTAAVDDPARFSSSKMVGAHFGLTPKRYQSGEVDVTGGITRAGDASVRSMLYEAAQSILVRVQKMSDLKRWGLKVAKRRGQKRAIIAVARKLATILHRMWVDNAEFRPDATQVEAAA